LRQFRLVRSRVNRGFVSHSRTLMKVSQAHLALNVPAVGPVLAVGYFYAGAPPSR